MSKTEIVVATVDLAKPNSDRTYSAEFRPPLNVRSNEAVAVALQEINFEMKVQNFSRTKVYYDIRRNGSQNWTRVQCGVNYCVENVYWCVKLLQDSVPVAFRARTIFQFEEDTNRVQVSLQKLDIKFSKDLANIIGFYAERTYAAAGNRAVIFKGFRQPQMFFGYEYMFLCADFIDDSICSLKGREQILRGLAIPYLDLHKGIRVSVWFPDLNFLPFTAMSCSQLLFKFLPLTMEGTVDFATENVSSLCHITLQFQTPNPLFT